VGISATHFLLILKLKIMSKKVTEQMTKYRWTIVSLLLFSTTINYMDRNVIGYLKDYFCAAEPNGFGWSATDFSILTSALPHFMQGFTHCRFYY
jgi:ACS family hexuronate transporter-like MFS transporter